MHLMIAWLAIVLAGWPATGAASEEAALLVTQLEIGTPFPLRSVELRDALSGERVTVRYDEGRKHRVLSVRPGRYYVSRIVTYFYNVLPATFDEPTRLCEVESGRVNYLGNIVINGSRNPQQGYKAAYEHRISAPTLASALADKEPLLGTMPWYLTLPGSGSQPLDAAGLSRDMAESKTADSDDQTGLYQLPYRAWWLRLLPSGGVRTCAVTGSGISTQRGTANAAGDVAWTVGAGGDRVTIRSGQILAAGPSTEFTLQRVREVPDLPCVPELYAP